MLIFVYTVLMIVEEISKKLNQSLGTVVSKNHRIRELTLKELLESLICNNTLVAASKDLKIGRSSLTEICKELFPEKESKQYWSTFLYSVVDCKKCSKCSQVLNKEHFKEYANMCNDCLYTYGSDRYYTDKSQHREWNNNWRANNPHKSAESSAKRKANKLSQTPENANLKLIEYIYMYCPSGWHVDHVIPLSKGGLHHEDNLCYLYEPDNLSKKDKMPKEVPDIMAKAIYPLYKDGGFL